MLKALFHKQWLQMTAFLWRDAKTGKKRSVVSTCLFSLLMLYAIGAIAVMFLMMGNMLCPPLYASGLSWLYFALIGLMATALGVFGSIFTAYSALYEAKDNDLLLSMPIPPSSILLVRMIGIYAMAFLFEAVVLVPTMCVYFKVASITASSVIAGILLLFFLPLLAVTLSCVLGWVLGLLISRMGARFKSAATVALSVLFITAYYYLYSQAYQFLQQILADSQLLGEKIRALAYPFYCMGRGAQGHLPSLLVFLALTLAIFALVYTVLSVSFIRIVTRKRGSARVAYKEKEAHVSTAGQALLRKEWARFLGTPVYMLNCGLGSLLFIIGAVLALIKGGWLVHMAEPFLGRSLLAPVALGLVLLVASMNIVTAPSVSLEGKNLWILQSCPVDLWEVLKAKGLLHMEVTAIPALLCIVCLELAIRPDPLTAVLMPLLTVAFTSLCAVFGLMVNLRFPNMTWTNETVPVKQGLSGIFATFGGWGFVAMLVGLYFASSAFLLVWQFLAACLVLIGVLTWLITLWLKHRGLTILRTL